MKAKIATLHDMASDMYALGNVYMSIIMRDSRDYRKNYYSMTRPKVSYSTRDMISMGIDCETNGMRRS